MDAIAQQILELKAQAFDIDMQQQQLNMQSQQIAAQYQQLEIQKKILLQQIVEQLKKEEANKKEIKQ